MSKETGKPFDNSKGYVKFTPTLAQAFGTNNANDLFELVERHLKEQNLPEDALKNRIYATSADNRTHPVSPLTPELHISVHLLHEMMKASKLAIPQNQGKRFAQYVLLPSGLPKEMWGDTYQNLELDMPKKSSAQLG